MNPERLQIRLSWDDPATGERREPVLAVPVALGREFARMPASLGEQRVARIVLDSEQVSRFHALIQQEGMGVAIADQNSSNGTFVNGTRQTHSFLSNGDTLQLGPYQILVSLNLQENQATPIGNSTILFHPETDLPTPHAAPSPLSAASSTPTAPPPTATSATTSAAISESFPPPCFQAQQVSMQDLIETGLTVHEFDYAAVGAGLGSFV